MHLVGLYTYVVECLFEFVLRLFCGDMVIDTGVRVVLVFARVARPTVFEMLTSISNCKIVVETSCLIKNVIFTCCVSGS